MVSLESCAEREVEDSCSPVTMHYFRTEALFAKLVLSPPSRMKKSG